MRTPAAHPQTLRAEPIAQGGSAVATRNLDHIIAHQVKMERMIARLQQRMRRLEVALAMRGSEAYEDEREAALAAVSAASVISGVSQAEIMGPRRIKHVVDARWLAWSMMRDGGMSLSAIARVFSVDHSTVSHGIRRHNEQGPP